MVGMQDKRNAYRVLVEKSEGKTPPRRLMHRWEYNIKMRVKEIREEPGHCSSMINPLAPELFFFNFSTPLYKM